MFTSLDDLPELGAEQLASATGGLRIECHRPRRQRTTYKIYVSDREERDDDVVMVLRGGRDRT